MEETNKHSGPNFWYIPYQRNLFFTDREHLLDQLSQALDGNASKGYLTCRLLFPFGLILPPTRCLLSFPVEPASAGVRSLISQELRKRSVFSGT